jgi:hypothetical protein
MAKSLESINRGLKLKAKPANGVLTVKLGRNKYTLPFETRFLQSESHVFIHIPPAAGTMRVVDGKLELIESADEALAAQKTFREPRKKKSPKGGRPTSAEMSAELQRALATIPEGFKLAYDAAGRPRLVKGRNRQKKS